MMNLLNLTRDLIFDQELENSKSIHNVQILLQQK